MRPVLQHLAARITPYLWLPLLVFALHRTLLLEEEEEAEGDVGFTPRPKPPPRGLRLHEREFLQEVDEQILRYSRLAQIRLRVAQSLASVTLAATVAIPVVVAANLAGWIVAVLAAVAAFAQGVQQVRQDQRLGVESHLIAVDLTRAARKYRRSVTRYPASKRDELFDDFTQEVDDIHSQARPRILQTLTAMSNSDMAPGHEAQTGLQEGSTHP
jgi:hypothetical protein